MFLLFNLVCIATRIYQNNLHALKTNFSCSQTLSDIKLPINIIKGDVPINQSYSIAQTLLAHRHWAAREKWDNKLIIIMKAPIQNSFPLRL